MKTTRTKVKLFPLLALVALIEGQVAHSMMASTGSGSSFVRLKANRLRRPESCRESLPRKSEDLPALVITGRVKELYIASGSQEAPTTGSSPVPAGSGTGTGTGTGGASQVQVSQEPGAGTGEAASNKAVVTVGRVIKGNQQLIGSDIIVSGFNSTSAQPCPNYVKPNDTYIWLLNQDQGERRYSIQGANLLSLNLNNLDRINAVAADEPLKRRGPIEDILCEAHYCPYGRCAVLGAPGSQQSVSCQCPDQCSPLPGPVCGSDQVTYTNECHLIKEGCRRQRPLFVTKEAPC